MAQDTRPMISSLGIIKINNQGIGRCEHINWSVDYSLVPLFQIGSIKAFDMPAIQYIGGGQFSKYSINYIQEDRHKGKSALAVNNDLEHERNILFGRDIDMLILKRQGNPSEDNPFRGLETNPDLYGAIKQMVVESDSASLSVGSIAMTNIAFRFTTATGNIGRPLAV